MLSDVDQTKMMIAINDAQYHLEGVEGLEQKLIVAMKRTKDHWMVTNEDHRFKPAVGAVMDSYGKGTKEYEWLAYEIKQLDKGAALIQAIQAGYAIDFEHSNIDEDKPEGYEPIGLVQMWKEINK